MSDARERVIVALDLPDAESALETAGALEGAAKLVKVGLTLFASEGPAIVGRLKGLGFDVFLDLKLHDIPHQVDGAVRSLAELEPAMLTVHVSGGLDMMRAAVAAADEAARESGKRRPALLGVTVLTSLDAEDLAILGVGRDPAAQVQAMVRLAHEAGLDGVVCSPREASLARGILGDDGLVVTPGVRPVWAATDDQVRVATPAAALAGGATHLVVGRPVTQALDPSQAFMDVVAEIE
ncbi:MAG: orotidine-5'-phosphate decarboxylase [Coriobacteriia bacterium]